MTFKYQRYPIYRPFLQGAFYLYYTLDTIALQTSDGFFGHHNHWMQWLEASICINVFCASQPFVLMVVNGCESLVSQWNGDLPSSKFTIQPPRAWLKSTHFGSYPKHRVNPHRNHWVEDMICLNCQKICNILSEKEEHHKSKVSLHIRNGPLRLRICTQFYQMGCLTVSPCLQFTFAPSGKSYFKVSC